MNFLEIDSWTTSAVLDDRISAIPAHNRPMTIIASLRFDDGLFLAADGRAIDGATGYPETVTKLDYSASHPIAWGFSGDDGTGVEFGYWLQTEGVRANTWRAMRDSAAAVLASLNGRKRELVKMARATEDSEEDTTSVLLGGYIAGKLEILQLDNRGGHVFHASDAVPFFAIGSGALQARIVHGITVELSPPITEESLMRFVMARAIPISLHCDFPGRLLRVTRDGITELPPVIRRLDD